MPGDQQVQHALAAYAAVGLWNSLHSLGDVGLAAVILSGLIAWWGSAIRSDVANLRESVVQLRQQLDELLEAVEHLDEVRGPNARGDVSDVLEDDGFDFEDEDDDESEQS